MKPNELRIGNYVLNDGSEYQIQHGYDIDGAIHQYEPIPMTSEWLDRLGFVKGEFYYSKAGFDLYFNDGEHGNWFPLVGRALSLDYVHELCFNWRGIINR